jgi:uncharacterized protein YeaO (DUF488 family)
VEEKRTRKRTLQVKRVYDPPSTDDGVRVLVDRLWPRGLTKTSAAVDLWLKDISPSVDLRRWFNHDPSRWTEFTRRYAEELEAKKPAVEALAGAVRRGRVAAVRRARPQHNSATAFLSESRPRATMLSGCRLSAVGYPAVSQQLLTRISTTYIA